MPRKLRSARVLAALLLSSIWGVRAADAPGAAGSTFECETAAAGDTADALFRAIERSAYRIETLARDCRSALLAETAFDAARHLVAWRTVLEELDDIGETLRGLAAGQHILSYAQRRAWEELETNTAEIHRRANETVRDLGGSILGVQSGQYLQTLLDTQDRSLRMARIVAALDRCGELRMLPDTRVQFEKPEWSVGIQTPVWE